MDLFICTFSSFKNVSVHITLHIPWLDYQVPLIRISSHTQFLVNKSLQLCSISYQSLISTAMWIAKTVLLAVSLLCQELGPVFGKCKSP